MAITVGSGHFFLPPCGCVRGRLY